MCPQAALFDRIFRAPEELLAVLAPHGWEQSPLFRVLHPTPQQRRDESRALRQRLSALCGKEPERPEPDDDEFANDTSPIDPHREVVELIGRVVWDVFSWEAVALASTPVDRALARMAAEGAMRIGEPHANPYPESPLKSPAGTARRILDDLREDRLWLSTRHRTLAAADLVVSSSLTGFECARARGSFPVEPVRALDALHLATAVILREKLGPIAMLSFVQRIRDNAPLLGLELLPASA